MITILKNNEITDRIVFEASDENEILAVLEAKSEGITFRVTRVDGAATLTDGIMRAALAYAENHGFIRFVTEKQDEPLNSEIVRNGFMENGGVIENIEEFFDTHKNCRKAQKQQSVF